jgi:histidinol-phosphate aminotransferase
MAGARVGYCIGEAGLIEQMEKVRNHFGMNRVAQIGALAALNDQQYLAENINKIVVARKAVTDIAASNGLKALASATNFVAIDCGREALYARSIVEKMMENGVFIRMPGIAPQNRCIRVSLGTPEDIKTFGGVFSKVLQDI